MEPHRMPSAYREVIMTMKSLDKSNSEIARTLGISEGTVRYWHRKRQENRPDGRSLKPSGVSRFHGLVDDWVSDNEAHRKRTTMISLYQTLREHHGFQLSYDALRRYIGKHYPEMRRKGWCIRIETPPGELAQVDWKEDVRFQIGAPGNWVTLQVFILQLSFSRKPVLIISVKKDLASFIHCHQEAFRRLGGLSATIRPDCLGSAVIHWQGQTSVLNERYRRYMAGLNIGVFPARPGNATDKGKVEKKIQDIFSRLDPARRVYDTIQSIQEELDRLCSEMEAHWRCGATGLSVRESYAWEQTFLRPLPSVFPEFPTKEKRSRVRRDGTVYFQGNYYQVPYRYTGRHVLCQLIGTQIRIYHDGELIRTCPWLPEAKGMVRLHRETLENSPVPISDTVRQWALEVADRQIDIYQELTGSVR
jgi:transposase